MALINVTVISEKATLFPWKTLSSKLGKETLREFYEQTLSGTANVELGYLSRAYLGKSKDSLDLIELDVELQQAVSMFGHFVKYICFEATPPPIQSAVDVLMNAQRSLDQLRLPSKLTKDKLDVLFNDVIDFWVSMSYRGGELMLMGWDRSLFLALFLAYGMLMDVGMYLKNRDLNCPILFHVLMGIIDRSYQSIENVPLKICV